MSHSPVQQVQDGPLEAEGAGRGVQNVELAGGDGGVARGPGNVFSKELFFEGKFVFLMSTYFFYQALNSNKWLKREKNTKKDEKFRKIEIRNYRSRKGEVFFKKRSAYCFP